ncbi:MAG: glycerol kinase GlpK [Erysipelotrichaceae bacterium]|nr:glycerol kinase GlpK [Erysipelotrichaceae bacterium]
MEKYILAIDQGTTSTRAILFDKNQNPVKVAQKEIKVYFPKPSWVEQDASEIWLSTLAVISGVFRDGEISPNQVEAIGITNQRETTIVWDKTTGIPIYHAIVWQSRQTSNLVDEYKAKGVEPIIKEKTGLILDPYFSATKIRWILDNVEGAKDNDNLIAGTIDTWLLWRLTAGKVHATDVTNASRTLLFNINTLDWDDELLKIFDIKRSMLPEIRPTSGEFGHVDEIHFFNNSCPITALVGDQQSALFGESCFEKGEIKNTYGTGGFMLINTGDKPIVSKNGLLSTVAWKIGDDVKYALEGSIFISGSLIQWERDQMHFFDDAAKTEEIARSIDDNNGVIIVPAFTGLGAPYWNQNCRGAIFGLTRGANDKHLVRAAIESMAYQSKDLVEVMQNDINNKVKELKVDGGAAANNYLLEFQADILGIPVTKCKNSETTALGACRLAGLATGYYKMDDFKNEEAIVVEPKMDRNKANELYTRWQKAVKATMEF